jgi:DNA-binding Lrp family transcriptional regulator
MNLIAHRGEQIHLDEIDWQIIGLLRANGRRPVADIARLIGLSESGARKRLDRLLSDGAFALTVVSNPTLVGMTSANILMSVELLALQRVEEAVARLPEVTYLKVTAGSADLLASVLVPVERGLYGFLTERLAVTPGVRSIQTLVTVKVVKLSDDFGALVDRSPDPNGLVPDPDPRDADQIQLDHLDWWIIGLLRADGRRPVADIARVVGLSESGARKRIDRLLDQGAATLTLITNPARVGMISANFLISVDIQALQAVECAVARMPEVTYLVVTAGSELLASVLVRADIGLYGFLTGRLATIRGVRSILTLVTIKLVKLSSDLAALVTHHNPAAG